MQLTRLASQLDQTRTRGLYRSRQIMTSAQGLNIRINGRSLINFCSNDYLGLANHPKVIEALKNAADDYGVGSGSAHLICGHGVAHHTLEEELADFTSRDRALLFSTGYMANLGAITALVGKGGCVFEDRLNHASLLDGGLLSRGRFKRFPHRDVEALRRVLNDDTTAPEHNRLVVTDGVFSMDGDIAPIARLADICDQSDAYLMVDDAHGVGVLGETGAGSLEHFGVSQEQVPILVGTLGKAMGTFGAFVAGSDVLIETLIQKARSYIYTTALPPAIAQATRTSLNLVRTEHWRRDKLNSLVERFRTGARQLGLALADSATPIQPVLIGDSQLAVRVSDALFEKGFLASAIRPPTVLMGSARLRISFSALHEDHHVDSLLDALSGVLSSSHAN